MIDIISNTDVKNLWGYLSSYYEMLPSNQKSLIEDYWKALMDGMKAHYYNLIEADLSSSLIDSKGYIENRFQEIIVNINALDTVKFDNIKIKNLEVVGGQTTDYHNILEYYVVGIQIRQNIQYTTAAVDKMIIQVVNLPNISPILLSWDKIEGIDLYQVYRKTANNTDYKVLDMNNMLITNGVCTLEDSQDDVSNKTNNIPTSNTTINYYIYNFNDNRFHLYIPTMKRENGSELILGTDFVLIDYQKIGFYYKDSLKPLELFILPVDTILAPIYQNFLKNLFSEDTFTIQKLLNSTAYKSYLKYSTEVESIENRALHFIKLSHAIMLRIRHGLSMKRLAEAISLYYNVPFAYEAGIIEATDTIGTYKIGNYTYVIPNTLTMLKGIGEEVGALELLCSGVVLVDYVTNPTQIGLLSTGNDYYYTIGVHVPDELKDLSYYKPYVDDTAGVSILLNNITPPGTIYKYY